MSRVPSLMSSSSGQGQGRQDSPMVDEMFDLTQGGQMDMDFSEDGKEIYFPTFNLFKK